MPTCLKPIDCKIKIPVESIRSVDHPKVSGRTLSSIPGKDLMVDK